MAQIGDWRHYRHWHQNHVLSAPKLSSTVLTSSREVPLRFYSDGSIGWEGQILFRSSYDEFLASKAISPQPVSAPVPAPVPAPAPAPAPAPIASPSIPEAAPSPPPTLAPKSPSPPPVVAAPPPPVLDEEIDYKRVTEAEFRTYSPQKAAKYMSYFAILPQTRESIGNSYSGDRLLRMNRGSFDTAFGIQEGPRVFAALPRISEDQFREFSAPQAASYLEGRGVNQSVCSTLAAQGMTGNALLGLSRDECVELFGADDGSDLFDAIPHTKMFKDYHTEDIGSWMLRNRVSPDTILIARTGRMTGQSMLGMSEADCVRAFGPGAGLLVSELLDRERGIVTPKKVSEVKPAKTKSKAAAPPAEQQVDLTNLTRDQFLSLSQRQLGRWLMLLGATADQVNRALLAQMLPVTLMLALPDQVTEAFGEEAGDRIFRACWLLRGHNPAEDKNPKEFAEMSEAELYGFLDYFCVEKQRIEYCFAQRIQPRDLLTGYKAEFISFFGEYQGAALFDYVSWLKSIPVLIDPRTGNSVPPKDAQKRDCVVM
eukprot:TRINITY_DN2940_c0_g1_i1.p1 TRINITY_DN2940_c0_g1~~TRINITY_DN2940_c0_g1_i1.p1  ORF type:complete len:548 (+),score=112.88 TRINITY_DN2940_c0_g1_i1:25-1644(+)